MFRRSKVCPHCLGSPFVGEVTNLGLYPAQLGNTPNNWIGRSQDEADPFLNGTIDDFRIYQYGLSPEEIAGLATGPGG